MNTFKHPDLGTPFSHQNTTLNGTFMRALTWAMILVFLAAGCAAPSSSPPPPVKKNPTTGTPVGNNMRPLEAPPPEATDCAAPPPPPTPTTGFDLAQNALAIARLESQIDKHIDEYKKRPRKRFIGARPEERRFAQYMEDWRQRIEHIGTTNYPEAARGKLYGSLRISVSIRADGTIESAEILRSSGYPVLDDAALRIVQLAAPFTPFPEDIRRDTDVIEITRTWTFCRSDRLENK